jgi:hypothetical protein
MTEPLEGNVIISRRILNHPVAQRLEYLAVWLILLLLANDKPRTIRIAGDRFDIQRGQVAWSKLGLQKKIGKGRKWLDSFLDFCVNEGMIKVEPLGHSSLITIINFDVYNSWLKVPAAQAVAQTEGPAESEPNQKPAQNREGQPAGCCEAPSDDQVEAFADSFTDLSRGIVGIPEIWWRGWFSVTMGRATFPRDWKRAMVNAFLSDWINPALRWKTMGLKNGVVATAPENWTPPPE